MTIIAAMLSANNQEIVHDAIQSVIDWVDRFLLIDTGITDDTIRIAEKIAGTKLLVERFEWCADFAKARNFSLERAEANGATWSLTIDTDERLHCDGVSSLEQLRTMLNADPNVMAWMVSMRNGSYAKERFIKVPTHLSWQGRTHEALCGATVLQRKTLTGVYFSELRKSPDQMRAKLNRDIEILREETRDQPNNARWWYYLGQSLQDLKRENEAVQAFRKCFEIRDGWAEQAAWACFKAAQCLIKLKKFQEAVEVCCLGLARQPGSPELAWLAGFCNLQMQRYDQAITWEQIAITLGHFDGANTAKDRIGFRHLTGWYDGPFEVMRHALRAMGRDKEAEICDRRFELAKKKRITEATGEQLPDETSIIKKTIEANPQISSRPSRLGLRVAVLGLYNSGSSATAGVLHYLGGRMARQFYGDNFEPRSLSHHLRQWWNEPEICEITPPDVRVRKLASYILQMEQDGYAFAGAKHPLLSLCGNDLLKAWGPDTKFIWAYRPLSDSITSLVRRSWFPGKEETMQQRLWSTVTEFFAKRPHLKVIFSDLLRSPEREIQRIIDYLEIKPTEKQRQAAIASIRTGEKR